VKQPLHTGQSWEEIEEEEEIVDEDDDEVVGGRETNTGR
jgi:hypothetical protein